MKCTICLTIDVSKVHWSYNRHPDNYKYIIPTPFFSCKIKKCTMSGTKDDAFVYCFTSPNKFEHLGITEIERKRFIYGIDKYNHCYVINLNDIYS